MPQRQERMSASPWETPAVLDARHHWRRARIGMALCALAMAVFAVQDAFTRYLVASVSPWQIMAVRLWAFALGALLYAAWQGRLFTVLKPQRPWLQMARAAFSAFEMVTVAMALKALGLAETHALFAIFPILAALMAVPVLGERLNRHRLLATVIGFAGALLILRPSVHAALRPGAALALLAAALFAAYQVAGRLAARDDDYLTAIVQISTIGAVILTPFGLSAWQNLLPWQWAIVAAISALAILAHLLLVKALEFAEAIQLQPFNYFLLLFALIIGTLWFGERPPVTSWLGAGLVVSGGLFMLLHERRKATRT